MLEPVVASPPPPRINLPAPELPSPVVLELEPLPVRPAAPVRSPPDELLERAVERARRMIEARDFHGARLLLSWAAAHGHFGAAELLLAESP